MATADGAFGYKLKSELKGLIGTCGKAAKPRNGQANSKKEPPPPPPTPEEEEVVMLDDEDHDL